MEGAAGDGGGEMAEAPCAGVGGGGGVGGRRLWGGGWKRKTAIAGAAIASAPVVLPPLLVLSAVGLAFSVPFGVFFAGYACTDKIMRSLLPLPAAPRSPQTLPPQVEEDEAEGEFAEEDGELWELVEEAGKGRTETGMAAPEQKGGLVVGEYSTGVEEEQPVAASSDEAAGEEEQREEKRTPPEGVRVPVPVPEWGGNGRQVFEEAERKGEEEEEELRGAVPSTKAEEGAASTVVESETGRTGKDSGEVPTNIAPKGEGAEGGRRRQTQEEEEEEEQPVTASSDEAAGEEEKREEKRTPPEGVRVPVPEWDGNGRQVLEEAERKEEEEEEELRGALPSTKAEEGAASAVVESETGRTGKDSGEAPTNIAPKDEGAEGGRRRQAQEEEGKAMVIPVVGEAGSEKEMQLVQEGEGAVPVLGRVGREREGLGEGPPAVEREVSIDEPSEFVPEYIAVVAERSADAPENAEFCAAAVVVVSTPLDFDEALMLEDGEEKKLWDQIDAIRTIVGRRAPRRPSCVEELRALYLLVGVEPPVTLEEGTRLEDVKHKLRLLKSIIGVKG